MARRSTEEGRTNDPDGLRNRILDAAMACFQSDGYCGTNMRDVMSGAGTTSGALHHHFPTKKALGLAVIAERVAPSIEETWVRPVVAARTAIDGVVAVFSAVAAELDRKQRVEGCPVNNLAIELSLVDQDFQRGISGLFERWRHAIAEKARTDLGGGRRAAVDADDWSLLSVAQFSGAMAMAKASQSTRPLRDSARLLKRLAQRTNSVRRAGA
jgi:TetR/AcrR family transcriptional regulator, transcriptional repressor for nem operon